MNIDRLPDPETDNARLRPRPGGTHNPAILITSGIYTHLGCVPVGPNQGSVGDYGGWYCPCQRANGKHPRLRLENIQDDSGSQRSDMGHASRAAASENEAKTSILHVGSSQLASTRLLRFDWYPAPQSAIRLH